MNKFILRFVQNSKRIRIYIFRCSQKWICNHNEKCVQLNKDPQNIITYTSRNACRLTCGRYGALWPKPTTSPTIGKRLFNFNPHDLKYANSNINYFFSPSSFGEYNMNLNGFLLFAF